MGSNKKRHYENVYNYEHLTLEQTLPKLTTMTHSSLSNTHNGFIHHMQWHIRETMAH